MKSGLPSQVQHCPAEATSAQQSSKVKPFQWFLQCRNLIKKPWVLIRVLNMNPNILGL